MTDLLDRLKTALADRYRIEREVGAGGMATVYLAEDVKHHRQVAVKVLRPDLAMTLGPDRFLREIEIAAKLTHPHIVPLYDSGEADGFLYYVLPYIEGESLRDRLAREGELPVTEAVRILRDVVDALAAAHLQNVVHRDIKPDNIMLSGRHALVMDFGVAKAVSEATGREKLTTAGVALGTPSYMAPEQATADPNVDHRADVYAVGVLAYEMLSGRPPFTGANAQAVLSAHMTQTPEPVTTHRETVPAALNDLVLRCLQKKAADRWQTAGELIPHLESMTTPSGGITPTGTQPVAAVTPEATVAQNHPVRVAGLFALASVGVLAIVYFLVQLIGLPDWVLYGAIGLLAAGLPIMLLTGHHERKRAVAATTGHVATPTGIERHLTWSRALFGGGVAFASLGVLSGAYMAMRVLGIGPVGTLVATGTLTEQDQLIVAEFEDRTTEGNIGASVTHALRVDLSQSPVVRLMDDAAVDEALERMGRTDEASVDVALARELAQREGAKAIVAGDVGMLGTGYVVSARLLATVDGSELLALRETANDAAGLIPAVDRLSAKLRERIGESLRTIRASQPLERVTTASLEALRLYTRSDEVFRAGELDRAADLIQQAIAVDSGFAMAYRRLAIILGNTGREPSRRRAAATRAYELRDRLPPVERHLATALFFASIEPDGQRVVDAYEAVLEIDPMNNTAVNNLALAYLVQQRYEQSEELYRRAIANGPLYQNFMGLTGVLARQAKWAEADSAHAEFERIFPDHPEMLRQKYGLRSAMGDYEAAEAALDRRDEILGDGSLRVTAFPRSWLFEVRGRAAEAMRIHRGRIEREERDGNTLDVLRSAYFLAELEVRYGMSAERASAALRETLDRYPLSVLPAVDRPYSQLAELYRLLDRPEEVRRVRDQWAAAANRSEIGRHLWDGHVAMAEERWADAIEAYRASGVTASSTGGGLFDIADAFDRMGEPDSALAIYETAMNAPSLGRFSSSKQSIAGAYRRMGEIHEAKGDVDKAVEYYNLFVELWENADPQLQPVVDDLRGRIERLVGERGR